MSRSTRSDLRPDISDAGTIYVTARFLIRSREGSPGSGVWAADNPVVVGNGAVAYSVGSTLYWALTPYARPVGTTTTVEYGLRLNFGTTGVRYYPVGTRTAPHAPAYEFLDVSCSVAYESFGRSDEFVSNAIGFGTLSFSEQLNPPVGSAIHWERLAFQGVEIFYGEGGNHTPYLYMPRSPQCTAACVGSVRSTDASGNLIHIASGAAQTAHADIKKRYRSNPDFANEERTPGAIGWCYAHVEAPPLERSFGANFFGSIGDPAALAAPYWTAAGDLIVEVVADRMTDPDTGEVDITVVLNDGQLTETFTGVALPWTHTWAYSAGTQRLRGRLTDTRGVDYPASYPSATYNVSVDRAAADILAPKANVTVNGVQAVQLTERIAPRDVLTLTQAAQTYIDGPTWTAAGSAVSGWTTYGGDPAVPTVVGGGSAMRLTAAAVGTGSFAHKVHSTPLGVGYRFYEMEVRSIGGDNVVFDLYFGGWYDTGGLGELPDTAFETQKWEITTGDDGEWKTVPLDLFVGERDYEVLADSADQWLGARVAQTVIRLATGTVIEIRSFKGIRKHESLVSVLAPRRAEGLGIVSCWTDGLPSLVYPLDFASGAVTRNGLISTISLSRPKSGWSIVNLLPDTANHFLDASQPVIYLEGGGFWHRSRPGTSGPLPLFMDATGAAGVTLKACGVGVQAESYPCAGALESRTTGTDARVLMKFRLNTGTGVAASLQGPGANSAHVKFSNLDTAEANGEGVPRASGSGLAVTGTPYGRPPATGTDTYRIETEPTATGVVETGLYATTMGGDAIEKELGIGDRGRYLWARFKVPSAGEPIPLAIDSARQWYYIGHEEKISTRRVRDNGLVQTSADLGHVWTWLEYDPRAAVLLALAVEDGEALLFVSRDGGLTVGTEVLTVDANSAAIAVASVPNKWVLLYEDPADDLLKRRVSGDGGVTWSTAAAVLVDGATVEAEVKSMEYDARAASILLGVIKTVTEAKVIRSRDLGENWESFAL